MQFDQLLSLTHLLNFSNFFKSAVIIILSFYTIFLFVILRQIRSMNTIVTQPSLFPILQTLCIFMIVFAIGLLAVALVVL